MSQTRKMSFIEAWANTAFGFALSIAASFIFFPLMGIQSSAAQNIGAVLLFTILSVARNYVIRRVFNVNGK
jgi:hypothetical protein